MEPFPSRCGPEQWSTQSSTGPRSTRGTPDVWSYSKGATGEWLGQWWDNKPDQASADRIGVAAGQALTGKDFTLQRAASIAGTVTGSDGTLIDGSVEVTDADGNELAGADIENGSYEVVGLTAGTYYAEFRSYGGDWLREWWNDKPALDQATPITVSNGQALTGVDVTLAKGSSIRGEVLNGKGNPVPTCVTVYVGMTDVEAGSACTGTGDYVVGGLPAGNYQVLFQPYSGAYAKQWWDGQARRATADPVTLGTASQVVADATLLKGGTLTGVVTDQQAKPVGGVEVRAYASEDEYPRTAVTDGQGRYTLMGLDDEDYRIQAVPGSSRLDLMSEWYEDRSSFGNADVVPVPNGATRTASFTLDKGATISGSAVLSPMTKINRSPALGWTFSTSTARSH